MKYGHKKLYSMKIDFKNKHPIVLLNFFPRIIGQWFIAVILWSGAWAQQVMSSAVIIVLTTFFVWPPISLVVTYHSKDPKVLELNLIIIESVVLGIILALLGFSLWPVITIFCGIMVGAISLNGILEALKVFFAILLGALVTTYFNHFYIHLATDIRTTLICLTGLIAFTFSTGYLTYFRSLQGKRDKKKLRAAMEELDYTNKKLSSALNELDHINKVLHECSSTSKLDNVTSILVNSLKSYVLMFDTLVIQSFDKDEGNLKFKIINDNLLSAVAYDSLKDIKINLKDQSCALDVLQSGSYLYIPNMETYNLKPIDKQIQSLIMCQSVIMFPIVIKNKTIGVLSLYSRKDLELDAKQIKTASNYINQISLIINNAILQDQVRSKQLEISQKNKQLKALSSQLAKYISPQLFHKIMQGDGDLHIGAKKRMLTVFFSDIVSFTAMSDRMNSEKLTKMLNIYLDSMTKIALKHGGTIDKYIGDAIMIFFGDPNTRGTDIDAYECSLMALEMCECLKALHAEWKKLGFEEKLEVRIGMHTGYCSVGNFGTEFRMDYTAIGSTVNLAGRLLTSAKPGQIIISEETYSLIKDRIACKDNGMVRVKGFALPMKTYTILEDIALTSELNTGNGTLPLT